MAKREFLMLAHKYVAAKHNVSEWFVSEKLDGQRCFWDGGISKGVYKDEVPWANTDKDDRLLTRQKCTGLWTRYGNVIHAPDWWLKGFPSVPLDGELYTKKEDRQLLRSIISKHIGGSDWMKVKYNVFDVPIYSQVFSDGEIKTTNYKKTFHGLLDSCYLKDLVKDERFIDYELCYASLCRIDIPYIQVLEQVQLPVNGYQGVLDKMLDDVTSSGGEGLMLRNPNSFWAPERSHNLLKVKKLDDMEGEVIGYTSGRKTDKGSKLLGRMGAMIIRLPNGRTMELSGFTDEERRLNDDSHAIAHPGCTLPDDIYAVYYPRGSSVTFRYRGKSKDGIPQEARYWRKKDNE